MLGFSRGKDSDIRIVVINSGSRCSGLLRIPVHDVADRAGLVDEIGDGAASQVR